MIETREQRLQRLEGRLHRSPRWQKTHPALRGLLGLLWSIVVEG